MQDAADLDIGVASVQNRGQRNDERYDRRAGRPEDNSKGFIAVAGPTETFLRATWTIRRSRPWRSLVECWCPKGTRRGTATETVAQIACGIRSPGRMESGETRIRKRCRRCDTANRCCMCASRFGRVQWCHPLHRRGAGCSTTIGDNQDTPGYPGFGRQRRQSDLPSIWR